MYLAANERLYSGGTVLMAGMICGPLTAAVISGSAFLDGKDMMMVATIFLVASFVFLAVICALGLVTIKLLSKVMGRAESLIGYISAGAASFGGLAWLLIGVLAKDPEMALAPTLVMALNGAIFLGYWYYQDRRPVSL